MTVTITIETGNDAMQTSVDVVKAIRQAADKLARSQGGRKLTPEWFKLLDDNGNTIGKLTVAE